MKILLSAYACEPNRGSEPAVGWNWAQELILAGHDVWVLTRENNKSVINKYYKNNKKSKNIHFIYYDLPQWAKFWKKGRGSLQGIVLYYFLWQLGSLKIAKRFHHKENFDLVHHVTFVTIRQPSFMGLLGIPFIYGPAAGGDTVPWKLRASFGLKGFFWDLIRDLYNFSVKFDPFMWLTFKSANKIFVTSEGTKKIIPSIFHNKVETSLAIGISSKNLPKRINHVKKNKLKLLFVGRFLHFKGMLLGLKAFSKFVKINPNVCLTIVGDGSERTRWFKLINELNITKYINWIGWTDPKSLSKIYNTHDLFYFPSLRDSGGMVVLEAMSYGLPVICLSLGGPAVIVNKNCGQIINVDGLSEYEVIDKLSKALFYFYSNPKYLKKLSRGALLEVQNFNWSKLVNNVYQKNNFFL
jgi:glycosyltransferase involved in cell wall biosynthesis